MSAQDLQVGGEPLVALADHGQLEPVGARLGLALRWSCCVTEPSAATNTTAVSASMSPMPTSFTSPVATDWPCWAVALRVALARSYCSLNWPVAPARTFVDERVHVLVVDGQERQGLLARGLGDLLVLPRQRLGLASRPGVAAAPLVNSRTEVTTRSRASTISTMLAHRHDVPAGPAGPSRPGRRVDGRISHRPSPVPSASTSIRRRRTPCAASSVADDHGAPRAGVDLSRPGIVRRDPVGPAG